MIHYIGGLLFLAVLAVQDIKEKKVSIYKLLISAAMAVIYWIFKGEFSWQELLWNAIPGVMLLLLSIITKENIGYGDGLTVIVLGLWTGIWFTFHVLCAGLMLSGVYAAIYLVKKKGETIPLIPFLLIGMEVVLLYE